MSQASPPATPRHHRQRHLSMGRSRQRTMTIPAASSIKVIRIIRATREDINLDRVTRNPRSPARVPPEPQYAVPTGMGREQFHAMGTTITLLLPERKVETGSRLVRGLFMEWELTLSRFLPESELSRLNRHPGEPVMVSELLYRVTAKALAAARATAGLYDPTMLDRSEERR